MSEITAAIILNGSNIPYEFSEDYLVFVDRGMYRCALTPDLIIGDFDSYQAVNEIDSAIEVIRFNPEKDFTDGEGAIREVVSRGYNRINIYGALGGRQDHVMCNLALLAVAHDLGARAVAVCDKNSVYYAENETFRIEIGEGNLLSMVPFGGSVHILKTKGLKYPLCDEWLIPKSTRGISNIAMDSSAEIEVGEGGVLIFVKRR